MTALLKFLLITICVLWLIKMLVRFLLPILFQKMVNKAQEQVHRQSRPRPDQGRTYNRPTGKINIDYIPPKDKEARAADKAGDFIEFEEIKDKK